MALEGIQGAGNRGFCILRSILFLTCSCARAKLSGYIGYIGTIGTIGTIGNIGYKATREYQGTFRRNARVVLSEIGYDGKD